MRSIHALTPRLAPFALALALLLPAAPAPAGDLDPLGPDSPKAVMCRETIFDLVGQPTLRFAAWHYRSREPEGPEHAYIECGQHRAVPDGPMAWICATEVYTAAGVASGKHFCEAAGKLLDAAAAEPAPTAPANSTAPDALPAPVPPVPAP